MADTELSYRALSTLNKQGWNEQKQHVESDLADLDHDGFDVPPDYAMSILEQYSGVGFDVISEDYDCRFEVCLGLFKAHEVPGLKSIVIEDSIILGKQLYPIGSVDISELEDYGSSDRAVLMVADDGVIYSSLSYVIRQEGCDINDFINRVIDTQFLWKDNEAMVINYSQNDPRLKEFRKKELLEKKRR